MCRAGYCVRSDEYDGFISGTGHCVRVRWIPEIWSVIHYRDQCSNTPFPRPQPAFLDGIPKRRRRNESILEIIGRTFRLNCNSE